MQLILNRDTPRMDCQEGILEAGTAQYYTIEQPWNDDQTHALLHSTWISYLLFPHTVVHGPTCWPQYLGA